MDCPTGGDVAAATQTPDSSSELFEVAGGEGPANDAYWRSEVAARLERYRSRRKPRAPRYPTLRLPFDSVENASSSISASRGISAVSSASRQNVAWQAEVFEEREAAGATVSSPLDTEPRTPEPQASLAIEYESNVIEFPRSAAIPIFSGDELAEPVLDRPRIVEAPEVIPPPPALGGILIEAPAIGASNKKAADDFLVQPASLARRLAAAALDLLVLAAALAAFAALFLRIESALLPVPLAAVGLLSTAGLLWFAYEFLFVVYTGSTPGWRIVRLRLAKFDGSPVRRSLRRWRVLASFLSIFAIGLGYLWSILDEEELCWHDRITHTCLVLSDSVD